MYCGDEVSAIVGDIGSYSSKFGYAGEDMPKFVVPSTVGIVDSSTETAPPPEQSENVSMKDAPTYYVGDTCLNYPKENMELIRPKSVDGSVDNWECMEKIWEYGFKMLGVDPKEHPLMTTTWVWSTGHEQEKYIETLFETFQPPCLFLAQEAVLSAFSLGRQSALVIEGGASSTRVVPVCDGYVLRNPSQRSLIGGDALTCALECIIRQNQPSVSIHSRYDNHKYPVSSSWTSFHRLELVRDIKESLCCMSNVPIQDTTTEASITPESYELPDGTTIQLGIERYQIPEILLNPSQAISIFSATTSNKIEEENSKVNFSSSEQNRSIWMDPSNINSLARMLYDSIQGCDADLRRDLMSNLLLCGGNSLISGLPERLHTELIQMVPSTFKLRFLTTASLERRFSVFIGGSILASLGSFQQLWVSRKEYDEYGATGICERRFP